MTRSPTRRRFLVPEVIQTSSVDCGPACLKAAFAGYGIAVSYDALRDACQTDVDGTSIDALESVANQLGLKAEQIWVPVDHITIPEISPLPAVCVSQIPGSAAHFVLAWRQSAGLFQVMDPNTGRRWVRPDGLRGLNFPYELEIDSDIWRGWAATGEFEHAMTVRLKAINGDMKLFEAARDSESPLPLSCLDAAVRMVQELVRAGGVVKGAESRDLLATLHAQAVEDAAAGAPTRTIPEMFYSALPLDAAAEEVRLRGAILLRLRGRRTAEDDDDDDDDGDEDGDESDGLTARSARRVQDRPTHRPWAEALRVLRAEGLTTLTWIGSAVVATGLLKFLEVLLLRGLLDIGDRLQEPLQRWSFLSLFLVLLAIAAGIELWSTVALRGVGRRFEIRLRAAFLTKLPRLADLYFRSRPPS
ncbi:MAG: cysteine peptidase family C39 domain-containing protein, partial [Myxococcota bacterium]